MGAAVAAGSCASSLGATAVAATVGRKRRPPDPPRPPRTRCRGGDRRTLPRRQPPPTANRPTCDKPPDGHPFDANPGRSLIQINERLAHRYCPPERFALRASSRPSGAGGLPTVSRRSCPRRLGNQRDPVPSDHPGRLRRSGDPNWLSIDAESGGFVGMYPLESGTYRVIWALSLGRSQACGQSSRQVVVRRCRSIGGGVPGGDRGAASSLSTTRNRTGPPAPLRAHLPTSPELRRASASRTRQPEPLLRAVDGDRI